MSSGPINNSINGSMGRRATNVMGNAESGVKNTDNNIKDEGCFYPSLKTFRDDIMNFFKNFKNNPFKRTNLPPENSKCYDNSRWYATVAWIVLFIIIAIAIIVMIKIHFSGMKKTEDDLKACQAANKHVETAKEEEEFEDLPKEEQENGLNAIIKESIDKININNEIINTSTCDKASGKCFDDNIIQVNKLNTINEINQENTNLENAKNENNNNDAVNAIQNINKNITKLDSLLVQEISKNAAIEEKSKGLITNSIILDDIANKEKIKVELLDNADKIIKDIKNINEYNDDNDVKETVEKANDIVNKASIVINTATLERQSKTNYIDSSLLSKEKAKVDIILESENLKAQVQDKINNNMNVDDNLLLKEKIATTKADIIVKSDVLKEKAISAEKSNNVSPEIVQKIIDKSNKESIKSDIIIKNEIIEPSKFDENIVNDLQDKANIIVKAEIFKKIDTDKKSSSDTSEDSSVSEHDHVDTTQEIKKLTKDVANLVIKQEQTYLKFKEAVDKNNLELSEKLYSKINKMQEEITKITKGSDKNDTVNKNKSSDFKNIGLVENVQDLLYAYKGKSTDDFLLLPNDKSIKENNDNWKNIAYGGKKKDKDILSKNDNKIISGFSSGGLSSYN